MADVKWIKITTDIFDDEKILLIESLPEADSIIVIWFKLLCLAGKVNNSGVFMLNEKIAYTDKMLATIFRRKETTVKMALETFEQFGMIKVVDDVITIPNWGKHQSLDQLESKKEYMRDYMQNYRAKQKKIARKTNSKTNSKTNVSSIDIDIDIDKDIDKEIDKEVEEDKEIYICDSGESKPAPKKETKHKYGEYKNVLLADSEIETLKAELHDQLDGYIERLSGYIASTGKSYKSHYATIRNWARKDSEQNKIKPANSKAQELDDFYKMAAEWAEGEDNGE